MQVAESVGTMKSRAGVGLRGMQERVRQLGGTLEIVPGNPGTRVIAVLPFAARSEESAE